MSAVKTIYAAIRALGIEEEDDRRDLYERITGKRRLREMTPAEKDAVVGELRRLGFKAPTPRRQLDGPYARKLQALWISAWNLGLVHNREDSALIAFVKRQTGIDNPRWLRDPADAQKAIEALKSWVARAGGVTWAPVKGHAWTRDHGAQVAWAQWQRLYPAASLADTSAFAVRVAIACARPSIGLDRLTPADWREVNRTFGVLIRGGE